MDELITQIGVGGVFVLLVVDKVFSFAKSMRERNGAISPGPGPGPVTPTNGKDKVNKEVCDIKHQTIENNIREIKENVTKIFDTLDGIRTDITRIGSGKKSSD